MLLRDFCACVREVHWGQGHPCLTAKGMQELLVLGHGLGQTICKLFPSAGELSALLFRWLLELWCCLPRLMLSAEYGGATSGWGQGHKFWQTLGAPDAEATVSEKLPQALFRLPREGDILQTGSWQAAGM